MVLTCADTMQISEYSLQEANVKMLHRWLLGQPCRYFCRLIVDSFAMEPLLPVEIPFQKMVFGIVGKKLFSMGSLHFLTLLQSPPGTHQWLLLLTEIYQRLDFFLSCHNHVSS